MKIRLDIHSLLISENIKITNHTWPTSGAEYQVHKKYDTFQNSVQTKFNIIILSLITRHTSRLHSVNNHIQNKLIIKV